MAQSARRGTPVCGRTNRGLTCAASSSPTTAAVASITGSGTGGPRLTLTLACDWERSFPMAWRLPHDRWNCSLDSSRESGNEVLWRFGLWSTANNCPVAVPRMLSSWISVIFGAVVVRHRECGDRPDAPEQFHANVRSLPERCPGFSAGSSETRAASDRRRCSDSICRSGRLSRPRPRLGRWSISPECRFISCVDGKEVLAIFRWLRWRRRRRRSGHSSVVGSSHAFPSRKFPTIVAVVLEPLGFDR